MKVIFTPSPLHGMIKAPPSKSMAHRMLISAGLATDGESIIHGISDSDDVTATLACLSALGVEARKEGETVKIKGTKVCESALKSTLNCHESGSTLRFFIPICLLSAEKTALSGTKKLLSRPLGVYENICKEQYLHYKQTEDMVEVAGCLHGGEFRVPGNISSQFISGLIFALPLCKEDSTIQITTPIESRSYLNLTMEALALFGVKVTWADERTISIPGNQSYHPSEVTVEGDYSNAAFFAALRLFGHEIEIEGLSPSSSQGDKAYIKFFEMLEKGTPTIHIGDCPDLGPILMAVAAAKNGAVFTGTKRLKIKESDRGTVMAEELSKFGVSVNVHEDSIVVYPMQFHAPTEPLYGHNDHRIVMALSTLLTLTGGEITGAEAVKKSLPEYFELMKSIGTDLIISDESTKGTTI